MDERLLGWGAVARARRNSIERAQKLACFSKGAAVRASCASKSPYPLPPSTGEFAGSMPTRAQCGSTR
jgi:hypothetical protein